METATEGVSMVFDAWCFLAGIGAGLLLSAIYIAVIAAHEQHNAGGCNARHDDQ